MSFVSSGRNTADSADSYFLHRLNVQCSTCLLTMCARILSPTLYIYSTVNVIF